MNPEDEARQVQNSDYKPQHGTVHVKVYWRKSFADIFDFPTNQIFQNIFVSLEYLQYNKLH